MPAVEVVLKRRWCPYANIHPGVLVSTGVLKPKQTIPLASRRTFLEDLDTSPLA